MTAEILQTIGGGLLTVCTMTVAWCLKQIVGFRERIAVVEAKQEDMRDDVSGLQVAHESSSREVRAELGRVNEQLADMRQSLALLTQRMEE